ncbi:hypothetical protein [Urechidicola croceus]|nr:hypothetical protein [Urechidicola croceus]
MDKICERYGYRAVIRASRIDAKTINTMNPFNSELPLSPVNIKS